MRGHFTKGWCTVLISWWLSIAASGQDYNYVQYGTRDGLAGSTVYDMCQDQDGFIWFATENGLSRYDGTRFKTYTVKDGLPDNEVLLLHADKKGRVWVGTFSKELCYIESGQVKTSLNDTLVAKLKLVTFVAGIFEDDLGNLFFSDKRSLYKLHTSGKVADLAKQPPFSDRKYQVVTPQFLLNGRDLVVRLDDSVFVLKGDRLLLNSKWGGKETESSFRVNVRENSPTIFLQASNVLIRLTGWKGASIFAATSAGAWEVDTVRNKLGNRFLESQIITDVLLDTEESTWFSTIGSGVYKLSSVRSKTLAFGGTGLRSRNEVFSLGGQDNKLIVGLGFSRYATVNKGVPIQNLTTGSKASKSSNNLSSNRLLSIFSLPGRINLLGFDAFLALESVSGELTFLPFIAIKSIGSFDQQHVLLASAEGVFKLNATRAAKVDTLYRGRSTAAELFQQEVFVGRIDGLWKIAAQKKQLVPLSPKWNGFSRRITALKQDGKVLWVATSDAGLARFDGESVTHVFSEQNGLLSNTCKSIYLSDSVVWVGTNKGLSKIDTRHQRFNIINYTIADGLPSNDINAIFVTDSLVYVGSPAGLTFFDEKKLTSKSICKLVLERVLVDSTATYNKGVYQLPHNKSDIRFSFVAISFRSAGDIRYYFRVLGLNDEWQNTAINELRFPAMPPGDYVFELYAVNKFGVQSETIQVPFEVAYPFWRQWWFVLLAGLVILSISWWMINRYAAKKSAEAAKELQTQKRLTELEQQALAAQINPHFIFNCLNTIQHFFLSNEKQRANQYLSMFATLVRETLDFSSRQTIRLSEEVEYLRRYIEMEKMRFKEQFEYRFEIDREIESDFLEIPSLLLQPYVENAIRHGIRHKASGGGSLVIRFNLQNDKLHCTVTDNGVGRIRAMALKGGQHIEYQSKGMDLGSKRIELLNAADETRAAGITITDLYAEDGTAAGTSVDITIPVKPNK